MSEFTSHMDAALVEAEAAGERGEVPVGAVILSSDGEVIARAGNETRVLNDPTAHAEILAIRRACAALSSERLIGCSLWVTLEPCPMCAAAIGFARIERLYFGASDPRAAASIMVRAFFRQAARITYQKYIGGSQNVSVRYFFATSSSKSDPCPKKDITILNFVALHR